MRVFTNICNKYAVFSNYGNKKGVILETKGKKLIATSTICKNNSEYTCFLKRTFPIDEFLCNQRPLVSRSRTFSKRGP